MNQNDKLKAAIANYEAACESHQQAVVDWNNAEIGAKNAEIELIRVVNALGLEEKPIIIGDKVYSVETTNPDQPSRLHVDPFEGKILE